MDAAQYATVAASGTVVLGGIGGLMRVVFKAVLAVRDNTTATRQLSGRVDAMNGVSAQIDGLSARVAALEARPG
jgi:hypothetical protein